MFALSADEIDTQSDEQLVHVVLDEVESRVVPGNRFDTETADRIVALIHRGELDVRVFAKFLSDPKIQYLSQIRRQLPALLAESQRIKAAAVVAEEKLREGAERARRSLALEQERLLAQEWLQRLTPGEAEQLLHHARTLLPIKSRHAQLEQLVSSRSLGEGIFPVTICAALHALRPASSDAGVRAQLGGAGSA